MVIFSIPGEPVGKARARTVRNGSKSISYTPEKTKEYERLVRFCYMKARGKYFEDKPIRAIITAYYHIPKSDSKKQRELKLQSAILPCVKVDIDNVCKIILDALNGLAYEDDKQIVYLVAQKLYSLEPRVEVKLEEIKNG